MVGVFPKGVDGESELAELRELARTAGVATIGEVVQHRARPDPQTFVGKGKLTELKDAYASADAEVLLVDEELSPTQQRSLENALEARVVDRTQLILDIFAQHASQRRGEAPGRARAARVQPAADARALAAPRAARGRSRNAEGRARASSRPTAGSRRTRVSLVKRRLRGLSGQRATRRKERERTSVPTIALAGYTNVGKSTLLNALTGAGASVDDRLFETLDPTTRGFEHDGKRYLVTDTVGFIRRLPTQLVEGFAATLEETLVADLVLHVVDASLSEDRLRETIDAVHAVLSEIGADEVPVELVLNKVDLLDPLARRRIGHAFPQGTPGLGRRRGRASRRSGERVSELFSDRFEDVRLLVPYEDGRSLAQLYGLGAPIAERRDTPEGVRVRARLPRREIPRFAQFLVAGEAELDSDAKRSRRDDRRRRSPPASGRAACRAQAYDGDAGLDLAACEETRLEPGERAVVPTGIAVEIPEGYAGFVQPRSGLAARHGLGIVNSPGLIDSGYRGEICVVLLNTDARESFTVEAGMRIAQLVIAPVASVRLVEVERARDERAGFPRLRLLALRWASRGYASRRSSAGAAGSCSCGT